MFYTSVSLKEPEKLNIVTKGRKPSNRWENDPTWQEAMFGT